MIFRTERMEWALWGVSGNGENSVTYLNDEINLLCFDCHAQFHN